MNAQQWWPGLCLPGTREFVTRDLDGEFVSHEATVKTSSPFRSGVAVLKPSDWIVKTEDGHTLVIGDHIMRHFESPGDVVFR